MDNDLAGKLLCALKPEVEALACADAGRVIAFFKDTGISPRGWELCDLLALGARLKLGGMAATGLLNYIPLETSSSEAAANVAAHCKDPRKAANAIKYGLYSDMLVMELDHFSSKTSLMQQATEMNGENSDFHAVGKPAPSSPGAKRWAAELNSPLHYLPVTTSPPTQTGGNAIREEEIRAIRAKPMITEAEAAVLFSITPKALSNKRRTGEIPRNLYHQKCEKGKVFYVTKEAVAFIENGPVKVKRR